MNEFSIPETKPMTPQEEIYKMGINELKRRLVFAQDKLKEVNSELEKLNKARLIWLDEVDRLSSLMAKTKVIE